MTSEWDEPDWLAELTRTGETIRRQMLPVIQAAKQFAEDARAAQAQARIMQQVFRAVDDDIRAAVAAWQNASQGRMVYAHAQVAVAASIVASADVIRADEQARVVVLEDSGAATDSLSTSSRTVSAGQLLALVLVWLVALGAPVAQQALPPEAQSVLTDEYAILALALAITWQILSKRDR